MFTKDELKVINIVDGVFHRHMIFEERGVATYPAREIISKIVGYCNQYIRNNEPDENTYTKNEYTGEKVPVEVFSLIIPDEVVKGIFWIDKPSICVRIFDIRTNSPVGFDMRNGKGQHISNPYEELNDDNTKLKTCIIDIDATAINSTVMDRTIKTVLYHELNHSYDNYNRVMKYDKKEGKYGNDNGLFYHGQQDNITRLKKYSSDGDPNKNAITQLYYRLFIPTEFNALCAQMYGDLESINSNNYNHDIEKTETYRIYNILKNKYLPIVERFKTEQWQKFMNLLDIRNVTVEKYRKNFINKCNFKLSDLFKRMAKTASLWYDEKNRVFENKVGINGWMEDGEYEIEGRNNEHSRRYRAINNYLIENKL